MKKLKFLILLFGFLTLLTACSQDSSSGGSPNGEVDEKGDFSYQFKYNSCDTGEHKFSSKNKYCQGLTDYKLNSGCALEARRDAYLIDCGSEFRQINFPSKLYTSGFDNRLQKSCSTYNDLGKYYTNESEYCEFLKNENLHQNCFWNDRKDIFQDMKCSGGFSSEPPQAPVTKPVTPTPNPNPNPGPNPQPKPNEPVLEGIIQEYLDQGIQIEIERDYNPIPGQPSYEQQRQLFLQLLTAYKSYFFSNSTIIKEISMAIYTLYRSSSKTLYLDSSLSNQELNDYLSLFEHRIAIENQIGIQLNLGIEIYGHEKDKDLYLSKVIQFFNARLAEFKKIRNVTKSIELGDYPRYFMQSRELRVKRENFDTQLIEYLKVFTPIASFFDFCEVNKIKLGGTYEFEKYRSDIVSAIEVLKKNQSQLLLIKNSGQLQGIEVKEYSDETSYFQNSGSLSVATRTPGSNILNSVLQSLGQQMEISKKLNIPIENSNYELNNEYLISVSRLNKFYSKISSKRSLLSKIRLSNYKSDYYSKTLIIGANGTDQDLEKIIQNIK